MVSVPDYCSWSHPKINYPVKLSESISLTNCFISCFLSCVRVFSFFVNACRPRLIILALVRGALWHHVQFSHGAKLPLSLSDHDLVLCVRKINASKYAPKILECRDYRNCSPEKFCERLSQINWHHVRYASDVNNCLDLCKDFFKERCDRHAPLIGQKERQGC